MLGSRGGTAGPGGSWPHSPALLRPALRSTHSLLLFSSCCLQPPTDYPYCAYYDPDQVCASGGGCTVAQLKSFPTSRVFRVDVNEGFAPGWVRVRVSDWGSAPAYTWNTRIAKSGPSNNAASDSGVTTTADFCGTQNSGPCAASDPDLFGGDAALGPLSAALVTVSRATGTGPRYPNVEICFSRPAAEDDSPPISVTEV